MPELTNLPITDSLRSLCITPTDVLDILKSLPVDKASGPDGINNRILKECQNQLSTPLCQFFNVSLNKCIMPSCWKEANVSAVFKNSDRKVVSNYRPISHLNTIEKLFEKKHFLNTYIITSLVTNYLRLFSLDFCQVIQLLTNWHIYTKRFVKPSTMVYR
jgi:hypothetical protein